MWALWASIIIAGLLVSFFSFRHRENKQLPFQIIGTWQGRNRDQIYAFFPNSKCKATAKTPDSKFVLIDGLYSIQKDMLTVSLENQLIVRHKAFVNGDMLVLTSLPDKQRVIFDRSSTEQVDNMSERIFLAAQVLPHVSDASTLLIAIKKEGLNPIDEKAFSLEIGMLTFIRLVALDRGNTSNLKQRLINEYCKAVMAKHTEQLEQFHSFYSIQYEKVESSYGSLLSNLDTPIQDISSALPSQNQNSSLL